MNIIWMQKSQCKYILIEIVLVLGCDVMESGSVTASLCVRARVCVCVRVCDRSDGSDGSRRWRCRVCVYSWSTAHSWPLGAGHGRLWLCDVWADALGLQRPSAGPTRLLGSGSVRGRLLRSGCTGVHTESQQSQPITHAGGQITGI